MRKELKRIDIEGISILYDDIAKIMVSDYIFWDGFCSEVANELNKFKWLYLENIYPNGFETESRVPGFPNKHDGPRIFASIYQEERAFVFEVSISGTGIKYQELFTDMGWHYPSPEISPTVRKVFGIESKSAKRDLQSIIKGSFEMLQQCIIQNSIYEKFTEHIIATQKQ